MNKKVIAFILAAVAVVFVGINVFYIFGPALSWNKEKAKERAEEYISQKYGIDMNAYEVEADSRLVEGGEYLVKFKDKNDVEFDVEVNFDFNRCFDNYANASFETEFAKRYANAIEGFWDEEFVLEIYPANYHESFNETSFVDGAFDYETFEKESGYTIYLNLQETEDRKIYAESTFKTLEFLKENNLNAKGLIVRFNENGVLVKGNTGSSFSLEKEYKDVEDVRKEF